MATATTTNPAAATGEGAAAQPTAPTAVDLAAASTMDPAATTAVDPAATAGEIAAAVDSAAVAGEVATAQLAIPATVDPTADGQFATAVNSTAGGHGVDVDTPTVVQATALAESAQHTAGRQQTTQSTNQCTIKSYKVSGNNYNTRWQHLSEPSQPTAASRGQHKWTLGSKPYCTIGAGSRAATTIGHAQLWPQVQETQENGMHTPVQTISKAVTI